MAEGFEPARYLSKLKGKDYLEVKWRLVWLRDEAPESQIRTEHVLLNENIAVFHAIATRIVDGEVKGVGEGYGSETPKDFGDYIEKAETKAIGRALGALGYGTQFCDDHDFGADQGRVVDAPVGRQKNAPDERRQTSQAVAQTSRTGPESQPQQASRPQAGPGPISEPQKRMLWGLASSKNPDKDTTNDEFLHGQMFFRFGIEHLDDLSKQQASQLIDALQKNDLMDGVLPPKGRVDPVERHQQVPEEPEWMRNAPIVGEPGNDRFTAA